MSRAKLLLQFTCNFLYSYYSLRIVVNLFYCHYSHTPLHSTTYYSERAGVFTSHCFNLFIYMLFLCHINVMGFVCLYAAVAFLPFLDEGKKQRLVAASCVSPDKRCFLPLHPSFLIYVLLQVCIPSFEYIMGACTLWSKRQYCD